MEETMVIEPVKRTDTKTQENQAQLHDNKNQERDYVVFVAGPEKEGLAAEIKVEKGKDQERLKREGPVEHVKCGPEKTKNHDRNVQQTKEVQEDLNRYR